MVHPRSTTHDKHEKQAQRVGEGVFTAVYEGNGEGLVFGNNVVRALLSACSQIAVGQMIAGQTSGVQRLQGVRKLSEGGVEVYPCRPRWGPKPSSR